MSSPSPVTPISRRAARWRRIGLFSLPGLLISCLLGCHAPGAIKTTVIDLPTAKLGIAEERLSYTVGVGDLDGDGDYDYLVRVWIDDDIDDSFETITYAIRNDGVLLWELNHHLSHADVGGDPTWTATLSAWDMDGDGKDEVMTQIAGDGQVKLVMLDGSTGAIEKSVPLSWPKKILHATIACLDGENPYLVISHGPEMRTIAYDRNLQQVWRLDEASYHNHHSWTNIYTFDVDQDGKDEIINGSLIIDDDGSVYLDGAQWDHPHEGQAGRSIVADIDADNPGYEWYLIRAGSHDEPYYVQPSSWEGPHLIDLDAKQVLWRHNLASERQGWGRMHRGWVHDIDPEPGLEMWATGYFWEADEWPRALNGAFGEPPRPRGVWVRGYSEKWFLYAADGRILRHATGYHVGYPLYWDDEETAEYFRYRAGNLLSGFQGSAIRTGMARAYGSGESIQADITGDWREEIIVASGYKLYIYSNGAATKYPDRPSPRDDHNYLMNLASIGTGLPKPLLAEWRD